MQAGAASSSPLSLLLPLSFCLSFTRRKLFCGVSRLTGYGNPGGAPAWKLMKLRNEEEKRETRCWRCVAEAGLVLVSSVLFSLVHRRKEFTLCLILDPGAASLTDTSCGFGERIYGRELKQRGNNLKRWCDHITRPILHHALPTTCINDSPN